MKNSLFIYFIFFLFFCYSKEFFYYDEELIIVTCLFIVFIVLNEKFSKVISIFFENKLKYLKNIYCNNFLNEEKYQSVYEKQLILMSIANIKIAKLLSAIRINFLFFFSFNFNIIYIYFKLMVSEFFNFLLINEKLFEKNINIFFLKKVLKKVDLLIRKRNKISFEDKKSSNNINPFL